MHEAIVPWRMQAMGGKAAIVSNKECIAKVAAPSYSYFLLSFTLLHLPLL